MHAVLKESEINHALCISEVLSLELPTPHLKVDKPILKCHDGKQRFSERGVSQDPKTGFVHIIADRPGPPGHRKGGVNRVLLQPWVIVRMTREKNLFNQIIYWEQNSFY